MIVMSEIQNDNKRKSAIPFRVDVVKLSPNIPLFFQAQP